MTHQAHIIGAGLAGTEAALVAARNGIKVRLSEMRPDKTTAVHETDLAAEIICSNSLGSMKRSTAGGCLKRELAVLGSPLLDSALRTRVPAGHALAVDRLLFAADVTAKIDNEPNIELVREEITSINPNEDEIPVLIATGPLTSDDLLRALALLLGENNLYYFDAISPSVAHDSINFEKAFYGSRYDEASTDYLNCPMDKDEYEAFYSAMINAERIEIRDFEPDKLFEGCLPVEIVAQRGEDSLRFGSMKPVGLPNPRTGQRPWAVVQLRREQVDTESWNLVGFQTRLKYPEQQRVFRMIPGLENAEFTRFGSMHRNAYIKSPYLLNQALQVDEFPHILIAGCLAGVEGYMEDIATGHLAGLAVAALVKGDRIPVPPEESMHGSLVRAITDTKNIPFQPIAATLGLLPNLQEKIKGKKFRRETKVNRGIDAMKIFRQKLTGAGYMIPDPIKIPD